MRARCLLRPHSPSGMGWGCWLPPPHQASLLPAVQSVRPWGVILPGLCVWPHRQGLSGESLEGILSSGDFPH